MATITGNNISRLRICILRAALKLELLGMRHRGIEIVES